ncbi:MAG: hypothetical protein AAB038_04890 [Planctomycetota bacterium]
MRKSNIIIIVTFMIFLLVIPYVISEVVILKDGNKYVGKVTDEGDTLKIATPDGEMTVKKDRIKAIYKDASAIVKETTDILTEAQKLIAGANKIEDPKERNATLDKSLEMLNKAQNICMDVIDVFSGQDGKSIGNQLKEINSTMKHARFLKVMDKEVTPPKDEKKPVPPPPEPEKPETDKPEVEPKTADPEKVEAAKEVYNLGLESFKNKKYEEARDFFLKAISYYEDYIEAYVKLGETYEALKNEELAYENNRRGIEIIDKLPAPPEEMVSLRKTLMRKTEKLRIYDDKLAEINQEFINSLLNLGTQCLMDKDYLLAEEIFTLVLKIDPNNKTALENMETVKKELSKEE